MSLREYLAGKHLPRMWVLEGYFLRFEGPLGESVQVGDQLYCFVLVGEFGRCYFQQVELHGLV